MIAAVIHFVPDPISDWTVGALWNILVGLLAFLMISTIRYPSFKHIDLRNRRSYINVYLLAMLVALIYLYSQVVLLLLATAYLLDTPMTLNDLEVFTARFPVMDSRPRAAVS